MVDEGAWDKQRIGIGASPTPPCWLSLRASILRVLGYRPRAAESQGSSAAPRRGRGLKPDLFVSFFIRNSIFLSQIRSNSSKFLQIPPEFFQANGAKIWFMGSWLQAESRTIFPTSDHQDINQSRQIHCYVTLWGDWLLW